MSHHWFTIISDYSSVVGFMIGLPIMAGTYYESMKARQEARRAREGLHSFNCLEFVGGRWNVHQPCPAGDAALAAAGRRRHSAAGRGKRAGRGVPDRRVPGREGRAFLYAGGVQRLPAAGSAADQSRGAGDVAESADHGVRSWTIGSLLAPAPIRSVPNPPHRIVQEPGLFGFERS